MANSELDKKDERSHKEKKEYIPINYNINNIQNFLKNINNINIINNNNSYYA